MLYSVIIVKLSVLFAFHQSECLWTTKLKFIFGKGGRRVSSHRLALLNITRSPSLSLSLSLSLSQWFSFYRSEISFSPLS